MHIVESDPFTSTLTYDDVNILDIPYSHDKNKFRNRFWLPYKHDHNDYISNVMSMYVPPNYEVTFFRTDPIKVQPSEQRSNPGKYKFVTVSNGTLISDVCKDALTLGNDAKMPLTPVCVEDGVQGFKVGDKLPGTKLMNARFVVIWKKRDFNSMIVGMCGFGEHFALGSEENRLERVWSPQTAGCDHFMRALALNSVSGQTITVGGVEKRLEDVGACFNQQHALDVEFGEGVPVCSFGRGSKDVKACATNPDAYKTKSMLANCASLADCTSVVQKDTKLQVNTSTPGSVECNGSKIFFPKPKKSKHESKPPSAKEGVPTIENKRKEVTPEWVWIMVGLGALFTLLFILSLAFVTRSGLGSGAKLAPRRRRRQASSRRR